MGCFIKRPHVLIFIKKERTVPVTEDLQTNYNYSIPDILL